MELRVVAPPADPDPQWLLDPSTRRPGELVEPVRIGEQIEAELRAAAFRRRLSVGIVATLVVERALVVADLERLALPRPVAEATDLAPTRRLSAGEADYLRLLTLGASGRRADTPAGDPLVTLPVRLLAHAPALLVPAVDAAGIAAHLEQAVSWEIAALVAGRTMGEWVLANAAAG